MNSFSNNAGRYTRKWLSPVLSLLLPAVFVGCAKDKIENGYQLSGVQVAGSPGSSVRLFNFANAQLDVKVNNIPLTNFSSNSGVTGTQIGLSLFPSGAWKAAEDGAPVTLPVSLFDKDGKVHIIIRNRSLSGFQGLGYLPYLNIDTVFNNDPFHPKDVYVMASGYLKVIDRDATAPAQPDHFKLRIINLGQPKDSDALKLGGYVVLTYADGTPVNAALNYVKDSTISPYVEIPYGSYQFKLYAALSPGVPDYTKQLAELPVYPVMVQTGPAPAQQDLVTRVRGFKPGGTYSIVVTPNIIGYNFATNGEVPTFYIINSYRILTEQSAPRNISWARMQAVNAYQDQAITFRVDGNTLAKDLALGASGDFNTVVQGAHHIEAIDKSGNTIASSDIVLYPYDFITAWVYAKEGKPAILFSNTDFTSTLYATITGSVDDGTDGSKNTWSHPYAIQTRYLNLSDVPNVTFTKDGALFSPYISGGGINPGQNDTLAYPQAFINLQPGVAINNNPFVVFPTATPPSGWTITLNGSTYQEGGGNNKLGLAASNPLPIRAFQSTPATGVYEGLIPGSLLESVAPLKEEDFASGTLIYPDGKRRAENGFYTVAIIGSASGTPARKLIVVKHNK
ncbi:hypothetical protein A4H97_00140 [Niastella yeongjuensis]|uniref:DUF4397 domain-containing protein n=1 Tax=Niastella yeongjuensis TaxID=354355 RepID=A0A1V9EWQ4_9BACT|nr:hypothetical protein [Niastella yeongjuensis]OQP50294.1 hypothetical protein A4H97_00140 [Niastella yeongjuensis]SEN40819.1 hypothetical protein SAMN05660816_00923 [Niastella yeongjuensis]